MNFDWDDIGQKIEEITTDNVTTKQLDRNWGLVSKKLRWSRFFSFKPSHFNVWYLGASLVVATSIFTIIYAKSNYASPSAIAPITTEVKQQERQATKTLEITHSPVNDIQNTSKQTQINKEQNNNLMSGSQIVANKMPKAFPVSRDTIANHLHRNDSISLGKQDTAKAKTVVMKRRKQIVKKTVMIDTVRVYQ